MRRHRLCFRSRGAWSFCQGVHVLGGPICVAPRASRCRICRICHNHIPLILGNPDAQKEEAAARAAEEARVAVRTEELEGLRGSTQDVWALWQAAVDLCIKNTSATAVYVANVSAEDAAEPPVPEVGPLARSPAAHGHGIHIRRLQALPHPCLSRPSRPACACPRHARITPAVAPTGRGGSPGARGRRGGGAGGPRQAI